MDRISVSPVRIDLGRRQRCEIGCGFFETSQSTALAGAPAKFSAYGGLDVASGKAKVGERPIVELVKFVPTATGFNFCGGEPDKAADCRVHLFAILDEC